MFGKVKSDEARLRLTVIGREKQEREIEAVIDTGYNGALTLPHAIIGTLGLRWFSTDRALLADGSTCVFQVYRGSVIWAGRTRSISVDHAEGVPLVGMKLLRGHKITIHVRAGGIVAIKPLL